MLPPQAVAGSILDYGKIRWQWMLAGMTADMTAESIALGLATAWNPIAKGIYGESGLLGPVQSAETAISRQFLLAPCVAPFFENRELKQGISAIAVGFQCGATASGAGGRLRNQLEHTGQEPMLANLY